MYGRGRADCQVCRRPLILTLDGTVRRHGPKDAPCPGSSQYPLAPEAEGWLWQLGAGLAAAIGNLPTHALAKQPAVLLSDLTHAVNERLAAQGLPALDGFDD